MIQLFYWYAAKTTCRTSIILWDRSFGIFKGIKKQFGTWSFEQKLSLIWIAIKSTVDAINATVALIFRLNRLHTIIQFNKRNKCAMHTSQVVESPYTFKQRLWNQTIQFQFHLSNKTGARQYTLAVYICWNSLYSPHFCIRFSSLSYSWVPTPVHWCTSWGYWNFR